jgi:hypothetical protein
MTLSNFSTCRPITSHDSQQIDCVLAELVRIKFYPERVFQAKEIHRMQKKRIGIKINLMNELT